MNVNTTYFGIQRGDITALFTEIEELKKSEYKLLKPEINK